MIRFANGPAAGKILQLRRAPYFLRVVISPRGNVDALDQLEDEPRPRERIHVYRRHGEAHAYHLKSSCPSVTGFYVEAAYLYHGDQPADAVLRDTQKWRAWAIDQAHPDDENQDSEKPA